MKILLLTHGTYLLRDAVVAGNSVRAYYLCKGLTEHGIDVIYAHPADLIGDVKTQDIAPPSRIRVATYKTPAEFSALLSSTRPDAICVGYWESLELLPDQCDVPVIVDVLAPRVLETRYQDIPLEQEVQRMLALYRKADRFICGNTRQRYFLIPWLLLAGFDCRSDIPVDVIPVSSEPGYPHPAIGEGHLWQLVNGGVAWPWRDWEIYRGAIIQALKTGEMHGRLLELSGKYIYDSKVETTKTNENRIPSENNVIEELPLLNYREMESLFSEKSDIGLELAERNVEREFSQSFRSIEYLRCGLPIICNDYIELAHHIRDFDAGWLVREPRDIPTLLRYVASHPHEYQRKSANAIKLVEECFHYRKTIQPLLRYLENPMRPQRRKWKTVVKWKSDTLFSSSGFTEFTRKAKRFLDLLRLPRQRDVDKSPGPIGKRVAGSIRGFILGFYEHLIKPLAKGREGRHIVIVTRKDVFPTNHGAAVRIERSAWGESFYVDSVFLITGDWARYYVFERGSIREAYYPWILRFCALFTYIAGRNLARIGVPKDEAFLYHPVIDWGYFLRLMYLAYRFHIVLYQAEFPGYAVPCLWAKRLFPAKTLLVEHNIEFIRIAEQYPHMSKRAANWLRDKELELCRRVDTVVTVSETDRQILIANNVPSEKVQYIPHGVDLDLYKKEYDFDLRRAYDIRADLPILVFHGTYGYRPNLEAIMVLAREILPRLAKRGVGAKVLAIGRDHPPKSMHPDIIFTGPVENLAPYLQKADLAVVPLQKGGGTRMKILEYFAAGLPVVATSKAVEGIPIKNHVHAWIEDDFDRIADAIVELLDNLEHARTLVTAGRCFVEKLDWRNIAEWYTKHLEAS